MRVLHIITRLILGGAQQNTVMTCAAQVHAGHEVHLVYGPIYGPEGSLLDAAVGSGAELVRIRSLRRAVLPMADVRCYGALRWLIRKIRPDVVHTHSSKAGIVGRAAAWHEHVPAVIHTIHGLPFHDRQTIFERNAYIAAERWAGRRCHRLIGVTEAMCAAFKHHRIGRPDQYCMAPSGVDVRQFEQAQGSREQKRRALDIAHDAPVIGMVARLDRFKGHDDLLDVLPALLERRPDLRVLIVGDGYHRAALQRRIAREKLTHVVIMPGLVPMEQVPAMYRAIDVLVLPSYQEGQPRTLIEALLSGCAIVGYDVGGIGEICIDGRTGRLVPCGDRRALADALAWMLDHPDQRTRLTDQGAHWARDHFSLDTMVRRLEEIYGQVLNGG